MPQPFAKPAVKKQQPSKVLSRQVMHARAAKQIVAKGNKIRRPKGQMAIMAMACFIFLIGMSVSIQTLLTNQTTTAKVAAISEKTDAARPATSDGATGPVAAPSTSKPTAKAVSNYAVAPNLPRYLEIPKLGVNARVLALGLMANGDMAAPNNVYDTGWYNASAKPGEPGAMLVDGHVSSWTTNGVFYGLKKLVPGDTVYVTRGDGQKFGYRIVKSQSYPADNVDMNAAITPVTAGKPGLNMITCGGNVKPGTNEFEDRLIVFAEQI